MIWNGPNDSHPSGIEGTDLSPSVSFRLLPSHLPCRDPSMANKTATIKTSKGTMTLELYADETPGTVANFEKLANDSFYDGTRFHRVIPNFMIQGGDPL